MANMGKMTRGVKKTLATILTAGALAFGSLGCPEKAVIPPSQNQKPVANLSVYPTKGYAPLEVSFDATKSYDPDGKVQEAEIEFGDMSDTTVSRMIGLHTYNDVGTYYARARVKDNGGALSDWDTVVIKVTPKTNQIPIANFTALPDSGIAPLEVNFDARLSFDPDGSITKYLWEFGDGSMDSTSGAKVSHLYNNIGDYQASLVVTDNEGARSEKTLENIVVKDKGYQIAFYSLREDPLSVRPDKTSQDIFLMDLDGNYNPVGKPINLTQAHGQYANYLVSFSPDGKKIAYESNNQLAGDGRIKIWSMNIDGSNNKMVTSQYGFGAMSPSWSPDGQWIAMVYYADSMGIAMIHPDGSELENIVKLPYTNIIPDSPTFSPDGNWIAFGYVDGNNNPTVYKVNINDKKMVSLSEGGVPFWESNGNILFTSQRAGSTRGNLWEMDENGANLRQITFGYGPQIDAKFNGEKIVFAAGKPGDETGFTNPTLYLINLDGTELKQIIFDGINNRFPSWNPNPQ